MKAAPSPPRPGRIRPYPAPALLDAGLLVGLALLAAAPRLPNLLTIPRFTDEQLDVLYTLPLYRHQGLPLVGWDPYNGALYSYLLAASLWLLGPQSYVPRLLSLALGSATVAAAYLLGKALGGRIAGLVAAGLLGTSAVHVLINSHVAWSNATTPLFATLAFCALLSAVRRASGPRLALSGLVFGLALQTHPSVSAFLPGAGLALALRRPGPVRGRWAALAAALFIVGYGNVVCYNLLPEVRAGGEDAYRRLAYEQGLVPTWQSTGESTFASLVHQQQTLGAGRADLSFVETNLGSLALNLPRVAGGLVETRASWPEYLLEPVFWIYGGVLLVGLVWPMRRGSLLPGLSALSFLLLLPLFTGRFEPIFTGRYLMPLLPLGFTGFGLFVADLWQAARGRLSRPVLAVTAAALVVYPLLPLIGYEQRMAADGQIDLDLIGSAAALDVARRPNEPIVLDEALGRRNLPADGDLLQSLRVFLELRDVPYRVGPASAPRLQEELAEARTALVVLALPYDRELDDRFRFAPIESRSASRYAAYRVQQRR